MAFGTFFLSWGLGSLPPLTAEAAARLIRFMFSLFFALVLVLVIALRALALALVLRSLALVLVLRSLALGLALGVIVVGFWHGIIALTLAAFVVVVALITELRVVEAFARVAEAFAWVVALIVAVRPAHRCCVLCVSTERT